MVDRICDMATWDRDAVKLCISLLFESNGVRRNAIITDDSSMEIIYYFSKLSYLEFYIEKEEMQGIGILRQGASAYQRHLGAKSSRSEELEDKNMDNEKLDDLDNTRIDSGKKSDDDSPVLDKSEEKLGISELFQHIFSEMQGTGSRQQRVSAFLPYLGAKSGRGEEPEEKNTNDELENLDNTRNDSGNYDSSLLDKSVKKLVTSGSGQHMYSEMQGIGSQQQQQRVSASQRLLEAELSRIEESEEENPDDEKLVNSDNTHVDSGKSDYDSSVLDKSEEKLVISDWGQHMLDKSQEKSVTSCRGQQVHSVMDKFVQSSVDTDKVGLPIWYGNYERIDVEMCFRDKDYVKRGIRAWSNSRDRKYKVIQSNKRKWAVHCITREYDRYNCGWSIRASLRDHGLWVMTKWCRRHNCESSTIGNENLNTASVLGRHKRAGKKRRHF